MQALDTLPMPGPLSTTVFLLLIALACLWFVFTTARLAPEKRMRNSILFVALWLALTGLLPLAGYTDGSTAFLILNIAIVGILAALIAFVFSRTGAKLAQTTPILLLTAIHLMRLPLELVLHQWSLDGFLPQQMTYAGNNFDIITGILAVPATYIAWRHPNWRGVLAAFHTIGLMFIVVILAIVTLSNPSPIRAVFGGYPAGNEVLIGVVFPYVWLATVIVPVALLANLLALRNLWATRTNAP